MPDPHLDLSALENAVASLADGIAIVSDGVWFGAQTSAVQNTLVAGVIQNFEFAYELSVKMVRRRIEMESDSPAEVDKANFQDMLRIAGEKGIVSDLEAWFGYRKTRNLSARTYDREIAHRVYEDTLRFIVDARSLLARLEARNG
jgi:nucleotidyltransferase substrate binding protein (TIGR01987 family)